MTVVPLPPHGQSFPNGEVTLPLNGQGVRWEYSQDMYEGLRVSIELEGPIAHEVYRQMRGEAPKTPTPAPVNHQDEALAAARRDAEDAKRRAAEAEARSKALEDELKDCQGEIEVLGEELQEARDGKLVQGDRLKNLSGALMSGGFASGGYVGNTYPAVAPITSSPGYSRADQEIIRAIYEKSQQQERFKREQLGRFPEPWHWEAKFDHVDPEVAKIIMSIDPGVPESSPVIMSDKVRAELEQYDPFTHGDNA